MTGRIVVGLDGSDAALSAMRWAVQFAHQNDCEVAPVHSWDYPTIALLPAPIGFPVPANGFMTETNQRLMLNLVEQYRSEIEHGDLITAPSVVRGGPAAVLVQASEGADLLVVGSRPRSRFHRFMLGSVGAHLSSRAPCPLAVVPDDWQPTAHELVIVGVDGSPHSDEAIQWTDTWVPSTATVRLVHGWDAVAPVERFDAWIDSTAIRAAAERLLDDRAKGVTKHPVSTEVIQGDVRHYFETHADTADLVVLGARGHGQLAGALLGSVATSTLQHLPTPTVIVRS